MIKFRYKAIKKLDELANTFDQFNSYVFIDKMYELILIQAKNYKLENKDQFKDNIEFLGKLMIIHAELIQETGDPFIDMFGLWLEDIGYTSKSAGQFFTPTHLTDLITELTIEDIIDPYEPGKPVKFKQFCDPACGTGRFMLSIAKRYAINNFWLSFIFTNVDVDFKVWVCCCMNAILKGIPSFNILGDSLRMEYQKGIMVLPQTVSNLKQYHLMDDKACLNALTKVNRTLKNGNKPTPEIIKKDKNEVLFILNYIDNSFNEKDELLYHLNKIDKYLRSKKKKRLILLDRNEQGFLTINVNNKCGDFSLGYKCLRKEVLKVVARCFGEEYIEIRTRRVP